MNNADALDAALAELLAVWSGPGDPHSALLRPGLSDGEIDRLMASTGLQLPDELHQWWSWHDGADPFGPYEDDIPRIGPGEWLHISLARAVELHSYHRELFERDLISGDPELAKLRWRPTLFPVTQRSIGPNHVLAIDTGNAASGEVVMVTEMGIRRDSGCKSLLELLHGWLALFNSGDYEYRDGYWAEIDPTKPMPEAHLRWLL